MDPLQKPSTTNEPEEQLHEKAGEPQSDNQTMSTQSSESEFTPAGAGDAVTDSSVGPAPEAPSAPSVATDAQLADKSSDLPNTDPPASGASTGDVTAENPGAPEGSPSFQSSATVNQSFASDETSPHASAPDSPPPASPDSVVMGSMGGDATVMGAAAVRAGKKSRRRLLAFVALGAVLLLLAGGASALYYVMNKPQNVLDMALSNAFSDKTKTAAFDGEIVGTDANKKQAGKLTYNGAFGQAGALTVSAKLDAVVTNVNFDIRSVDGSSYFVRVGGLEGLPQLLSTSEAKQLAPLVSTVNNQWFEINQSLIKQFTGSEVSTKLSDSDRTKMVNAYKQHRFLVAKQSFVDQDILGKAAHHYRVAVDKTKLKAFYAALKNANLDTTKITSDQLSAFDTTIDDSKIDTYLVDVWIDKGDRLFRQVAYTKTESDGSSTSLRFTVDSYNQPLNVEKPAGSKSLLDVLGQFVGNDSIDTLKPINDNNINMFNLPSGISL